MSDPTSPTGPTRPPTEMPPGRPLPPPGAPGIRRAAAVAVAALLVFSASSAEAAMGGGAMPYSGFLTTFRQSLTGEIPMIISVIAIVCGVGGWIVGGELSGMMMYIMRAVCGASIILGVVAFLANIGVGGAVLPMAGMLVPA